MTTCFPLFSYPLNGEGREVLDIQKPQDLHRVFVQISTDHRVSCMGHHGKSSKLLDDLKAGIQMGSTLPKTNIAPENRPCQKETSIPTIHFQGLC